jgi:hypothetical protein
VPDPAPLDDDDDDLDGLLEDAPDDLHDENELLAWFGDRLGIDDEEFDDIAFDAIQTGGILAALAFLKLFTAGWEALDDAQDAATAAQTEHEGPALDDRLREIASDLKDDLGERLDEGWGDADGTEVSGATDDAAQAEYTTSKSDADRDEGWEYAVYIAEPDACFVCQDCNGTVLRSDDPWWDDHDPDNNHPGCRCVRVPLSEDEAKGRGISDEAPDVEVSGWKDTWPPDTSDYPAILDGVYHEKIARFYRAGR